MSNPRKRVLFHLPIPIDPKDYNGTQGRVLAMLKYFSDRKDVFAVDAIAGNKFGQPEWTLERRKELLNSVENVFIYEGQSNWLDFFYTRSQSLYYQSLLRQQLPVDSDYFAPPGYVRFLKGLLSQKDYDFVWINNLDYAHLATDLQPRSVQTVIDIHDVTSQFRLVRKNIDYSKNLKFDYEANFGREIALLNKFDSVLVDSQREKDLISPYLPPSKFNFIPTPPDTSVASSRLIPYASRRFEYDLLFVGAVNQPNKDGLNFFLNSIFPLVLQAKPETRLAIAGKISSAISIDDALKGAVDCLGYVPDLGELYFKSKVAICPLISGAGTKFKLVEAMAYAMPIVATQTSASALSLVDDENAFITDDPVVYAQKILCLLNEPALAQQFSEEVFSVFESQHSTASVYSKLDEIFSISPPQLQQSSAQSSSLPNHFSQSGSHA
jgi:glycosyltransferase involved in cell wall biosynthesis